MPRPLEFIARHRGGLLEAADHRALMAWSLTCVRHVLPYWSTNPPVMIETALHVGSEWSMGEVPAGDAINMARQIHRLARTLDDPVQVALMRAAGQAVSTAHMADHSLGGALYSLKAVKLSGLEPSDELAWQLGHLPSLPAQLAMVLETYYASKRPAYLRC